MSVVAIVDNQNERISEFKSISDQVDFDGNVQFFNSGESILNYINSKLSSPAELPDMIFFNITIPIVNGRSFFVEYGNLPESFRKNCQVVTFSNEVNDRFFIANDLNQEVKEVNPQFSELYEGLLLSDKIQCYA